MSPDAHTGRSLSDGTFTVIVGQGESDPVPFQADADAAQRAFEQASERDAALKRKIIYQIVDHSDRPFVVGTVVKDDEDRRGVVTSYHDDYDADHDGERFFTCQTPSFDVLWDDGECENIESDLHWDMRYVAETIFWPKDEIEVVQ